MNVAIFALAATIPCQQKRICRFLRFFCCFLLIFTACDASVAVANTRGEQRHGQQQQKQQKQQQKQRRERPKVTKLELSTDEGFRIYQFWTTQAFTSLLSAFLQAKINANELPPTLPEGFSACFLRSKEVPAMAKCISQLLASSQEQKSRGKLEEGLANDKSQRRRFERYRTKKNNNNNNGRWIGQFQLAPAENGWKKAANKSRARIAELRRRRKNTNHILMNSRQNSAATTAPVPNVNVIMLMNSSPASSPRLAKYGRLPVEKMLTRHSAMDAKRKLRRKRESSFPRPEIPEMPEITAQNIYAPQNVRRADYALREPRRSYGLSPVGGLARLLMANVLGGQNRTRSRPWQETVLRVQELQKFKKKLEAVRNKDISSFFPQIRANQPLNKKQSKPEIQPDIGANEPTGMGGGGGGGGMFLGRQLREDSSSTATMDIKSGGGQQQKKKSLDEQISELVKDGIRIGIRLARQQQTGNGTGEEGEGGGGAAAKGDNEAEAAVGAGGGDVGLMDVLSPRFLSISERNVGDKASLFSPSLFSLHDRGHGLERELSLPNLLRGSGQLTGRDQQEWLNLILEASGVNRQIDALQVKEEEQPDNEKQLEDEAYALEERYKHEFRGLYLDKEDLHDLCDSNFEERKADTWLQLNRKLSEQQRQEINRTGYALLNRDQLEFVYGPGSPFNDSQALARLRPLLADNSTTVNKLIELDIQRMAEMHSFDVRQNDVVLSPVLFNPAILNPRRTSQPIILSPIVFSPTILSPTLMGPAILSPRVFSPTILSPRVMTPLILSPFIFSSIILNPIVMQPFILSPGLLNGVILSPFVMNPMMLSSQILHPFILSPLVMAPGLANPTALGPLVLSPFVMNPQVLSPKAISGLFLSPYALSPVLYSPVYAYLVVLSPSWLS